MSGWEQVSRGKGGKWTGDGSAKGKAAFHREKQGEHLSAGQKAAITRAANLKALQAVGLSAGQKAAATRAANLKAKAPEEKIAAKAAPVAKAASAGTTAQALKANIRDDTNNPAVGQAIKIMAANGLNPALVTAAGNVRVVSGLNGHTETMGMTTPSQFRESTDPRVASLVTNWIATPQYGLNAASAAKLIVQRTQEAKDGIGERSRISLNQMAPPSLAAHMDRMGGQKAIFVHEFMHHLDWHLEFGGDVPSGRQAGGITGKAIKISDGALSKLGLNPATFRADHKAMGKEFTAFRGNSSKEFTYSRGERAVSKYGLTSLPEWHAEAFRVYSNGGERATQLAKFAPATFKFMASLHSR